MTTPDEIRERFPLIVTWIGAKHGGNYPLDGSALKHLASELDGGEFICPKDVIDALAEKEFHELARRHISNGTPVMMMQGYQVIRDCYNILNEK